MAKKQRKRKNRKMQRLGRLGKGKAKVRGGPEYYRRIVAMRKDRRKKVKS